MSFMMRKIFKSYSEREVEKISYLVDAVNVYEEKIKKLSDQQLKNKTNELRNALIEGEMTLDDILPEAFAVVCEASYRVLTMRPFNVQIQGGIILHQGRIAEMRTGEGKTLVSVLPAYLNALEGRGVHVVTVNDYLAQRDHEWVGEVLRFLDLKTGCVLSSMSPAQRREAYKADVVHVTNSEVTFDYLRDNMAVSRDQLVLRDLNYAIIDEVDSILIDEARTPLIISASAQRSTKAYGVADIFAKQLVEGKICNEDDALNPIIRADIEETGDYVIDEKANSVTLTQEGITKAEKFYKISNYSDPEHLELQHYNNNALKANYILHADKDYVVKDDEIIIVDEFTGRLMIGRRYSDGLHQAIEAKEGVKINGESKTLATITYQNFFNKYTKKCGMTGTAITEQNEFREIYGMDVVAIVTNRPVVRIDHHDCVYKTENAKFKAIIDDVKKSYIKGQPVLIGTVTIDKSEKLSKMLKKENIKHNVLNAKYHEKEAEMISQAGQERSVTVATNMAGRGTDIKLTEEAKKAGGLKVIGTERHESRRIDNQLRGRSGRQGDPGESRFYVSLEDNLMRLFGSDKMLKIADVFGLQEDDVIEHKLLSKSIENAQKKVEANNFSIRNRLLEYDQPMNEQREIIYRERKKILMNESMEIVFYNMLRSLISRYVDLYTSSFNFCEEWQLNNLNEFLKPIFKEAIVFLDKDSCTIKLKIKNNLNYTSDGFQYNMLIIDIEECSAVTIKSKRTKKRELYREVLKNKLYYEAKKIYKLKEKDFGEQQLRAIERMISLKIIDQHWMEHIDNMSQMRQSVSLRAYAQRDPAIEYKQLSYTMFDDMNNNIQQDIVFALFNVRNIEIKETDNNNATTDEDFIDDKHDNIIDFQKHRKIGRNDLCPCGSGKKYKNCCGKLD